MYYSPVNPRTAALFLLSCAADWVVADEPHYGTAEYDAFNRGDFGLKPQQSYHTVPWRSPRFQINLWEKEKTTSETHLFINANVEGQADSPVIMDARDMSLVYMDPSWDGGMSVNYQNYNGTDYLTFWHGRGLGGWGDGSCAMLDQYYNYHYDFSTTDVVPTGADNHEFQLTHDGGVLLNNYNKIPWDFTSLGGPANGLLHDSLFQEIDIETKEARFTWRASDHFEMEEAIRRKDDYNDADGGGWDWFHMNSIQKTPDGNYLISARHLCLIALINGTDGTPMWQLGGHRNSFRDISDGRATNIVFQHNARFIDDDWTEITLFDNRAADGGGAMIPGCDHECSRAVHLKLNFEDMTVQLLNEYHHPYSVQAWAQGGTQRLPNGHQIVAWGTVPSITEHTPEGEAVFEMQVSPWSTAGGGHDGVTHYRAYKFNYKAYPPWPPAIALADGTIYVSWNGATEVAKWALYGGKTAHDLQPQNVVVDRAGFETAIKADYWLRAARVAALDADGNQLGTTDVIDMRTGETLSPQIQLDRA